MHKNIEQYILDNNLVNESEVWPLLKNQMTRIVLHSKGVTDKRYKSNSYIPLFVALLLSFINLLRARVYTKKTAYFGAFSRISISDGNIHDEFVSITKQKNSFSLYHCSNFEVVSFFVCLKSGVVFENITIKVLAILIERFGWHSRVPEISGSFFELLNQEYGVTKREVVAILLDYECKKKAYKKLLKWLRVSNVEVVSAYTKPAIVSAANELSLNTLEYQHGLLAPYHPSYHYSGSELWRSSMLPTRLRLSSSFWKKKMCQANFVANDALEVNGALPKVSEILKKQIFNLTGNEDYFIFTGQGICYEEVADFVLGLIEKFPGYAVFYRPHPREYQNYTQISALVKSESFKVVDRDVYQDTLALIGASKAHFSIFSSCHFEALELLGRTYVLDVVEDSIMKTGSEDENIIFITNASQITDI
ncbi:hypothetical protein [Ferrimonas lipolytica]|uniref:Capsule polysaccharide biosynthesis protein n=1 Tax=Ferrimonas lipolytica TaxID=2724191 RepID=A0A6H1UE00_9GAMM|nr:hypothetical protein [Ferrimonas lipolytica]QIZ77315.1 hypothetical protein HER31_10755 [Ferrimonas lipolytica]